MSWTYWETPGTATADQRRDAVRVLVGDIDTNNQLVSDEQIVFALSQAQNDVYNASAIVARMLAAKYASRADSKLDEAETKFSQLRASYLQLASSLEAQSTKFGSMSLGVPLAGGIRISDVNAARQDTDRLPPSFETGQFNNPTFDVQKPDGVREQ